MLEKMSENKTRKKWSAFDSSLWSLDFFYRKWGKSAKFPAGGDMITVIDKYNGA